MTVNNVSDPNNILTVLTNAKPELILMDIYTLGCLGIELAKVIRQEDDFLTKPIEDEHLISAVSIRTKQQYKGI